MNKAKSKSIHRNNYKEIRNKVLPDVEELIIEEVGKTINKLLSGNKSKSCIGIYWPLTGEVDLRSLKVKFNLQIALPASKPGGEITYHRWLDRPLKRDSCGIPAPLDEPKLRPEEISLLLVPGIAIDERGYRLGYGGGFFDRLRAKNNWRSIPAIVVLPKACFSDDPLPKDPWDIPFNGWINEDGGFQSIHKSSI